MYDYEIARLEPLVGAKVNRVAMNEDNLVFDTDKGFIAYYVEGDCCSWSYFYDFHGVWKLTMNGPVTQVDTVELDPGDAVATHDDCLQVYGYRLITESPKWGEQSSVFSFRNESNGYYGGWMNLIESDKDWSDFFNLHELHSDVVTLD